MFRFLPRFFRVMLGMFMAGSLIGAPYEPEIEFSLTEKWRWHELEALSGYVIDRGVEDASGQLVFTASNKLLIYDGYHVREIAYPVTDSDFDAYDLMLSQNGRLYLNSSHGVYSFYEGTWRQHLVHRISIQDLRPTFARNGRGLEIVSLESGVYRIDGDSLERLPEIDQPLSGPAFDPHNRLWGYAPTTGEVQSIQFHGNAPALPLQRKAYRLDFDGNVFPSVIASPASDEVWTVNWRPLLPAMRFAEDQDKWIPHDLTPLTGNNRHTYGAHLNARDMVIFSKSAVLIKHRQDWKTIEFPEFDFPTNQPFFIMRANGRLVLGGRGEKIYQIDYDSPLHHSYHGLHFQCDVGGRNQWFISIEGYVVERDTVYDTWNRHTENVIDTPLVIIKSSDDFIWAAGSHEGVASISYFDGRHWTRQSFPALNSLISHLSARELPDGAVVFGSGEDDPLQPAGGMVRFVKSGEGYTSHYVAPPTVPHRPVGIAIDADQNLWFGGRNLTKTNLNAGMPFEISQHDAAQLWVDDVTEDDLGRIWVALWERGLYRFDGSQWTQHKLPEEIASTQVSFILKDQFRPHHLWFATDRGVSRFDGSHWFPQAMPSELRFDREAGSLHQSSDGAVWVNMATRDWFFRKTSGFYITKRLHDSFKTVRFQPDDAAPVLSLTTEIAHLISPANVLVGWSGADKWSDTPQHKLKYSYRLNDAPWSPFREGDSTVLLDIPSGSHRFEVRALDLDGNLSTVAASTLFQVSPPVWQRAWFIVLVLLTLVIIVGLVFLLFRQRIRHFVQLEEFKLQFFTNISHELRTPLTVILGPLESQLAKLPADWDRKPLEIAYKNAQRTLGLIDQLLDFRSAESGNIKINLARSDLAATVREIHHLIKPLAEDRSQTLELSCEPDRCVVWFDAEVIEKILNNLISNAVKYTPVSGRISVHFRVQDAGEFLTAIFVVEDNGIGIPSESRDDIFNVFFRAGNATHHKVRGSGIGLAFTKQLVEACAGTIEIDSPITVVDGHQVGSRFTVSLPLKKVPPDHSPAEAASPSLPAPAPNTAAVAEPESTEEADDRPLLLIVEDDDEIREFLCSELQDVYQVTAAANGSIALSIATARIPDLIITDVMMPEIDGKELCRLIKQNEHTSHIPVIMLTALKSERHELEGLELGADDYLTKPIRLSILKKRIQNLLESRQKLQALFQRQTQTASVVPTEVTTNPLDAAFMDKAVVCVETHLADALFDVEAFADIMAMSRMTLYRKFKAITGHSPSDFIRTIRMNKAAALLATKQYNVSETADLVGLPDLSSFSTAFKKHFKVSPSQYTRRNETPKPGKR